MWILPYILFYLLTITQPAYAQNSVGVSNAWINEAPPAVKVLAGYLTIKNNTDEAAKLDTIRSPVFERIEFHLTKMENGVASMLEQDEITIPPRSEFSFSPGEYHLMLFNPEKLIRAGDIIPLQLIFSNGTSIDVTAEVKRGVSSSHDHH